LSGILDGLRIVDLSRGLAGPVATLLLAEAGADVVKVEPPTGDPMRAHASFATWARSKRSVVLDLTTDDGRHQLDSLLATADVVVHSMRPSLALRHGLDDASLAERHPHLVASSVLGYPIDSPDAERPGHELLVQARLGLMDEQQGHRDGPVAIRFPVGNWGAAYLAAIGILARLIYRGRTGRVGPAHTSVLQGALITLTMHWARAETPTPMLTAGLPKNMAPSLYECADGVWIHVMSMPNQVPLMVETVDALGEERVAAARAEPSASYFPDYNVMKLAFLQRPSSEWLAAFWDNDIAVLPAQPLGDILKDPQAIENGYVVEVADPVRGATRQAGTPFATTPPSAVRRPAPQLGEHTGELLDGGAIATPRTPTSGAAPAEPSYLLSGIRVLDLGNFLAGPFAPMVLADLGADVIKLESTKGDQMRGVERVFAGCNRGKRSVAVDLKSAASRPIVEALVRQADVVTHNMRLPAARKLGIDYDSLRDVNPTMVFCHSSAYGPRGERCDWPGYDQLFQAFSGWEVEGGGEGNPPMWHRMGMMDHQNALGSVVAILLGLLHRDRTGEGQHVTSSILGGSALTASETLLLADGTTAPYARLDHEQTGLGPFWRIYPAADGWVALAAVGERRQAAALNALGVTSADDIAAAIAAKTMRDALSALEAAGVPAEEVRLDQMSAFLDSAANQQSRLAVSYPHATYGTFEQIGALWSLGDVPLRLDLAPPALGQHTRDVLTEIGLSPSEIDELIATGVAAQS
jgi:crotonobetainyl-CoA:carnitine CoA-transferase CaiB-like acyl-CoA transferase